MPATDDGARAAALDFSRGIAALWQEQLGPRLLGVYLIGSLAHGGFNRRYSDIDMAVVAEEPLADGVLDEMRTRAAGLSPELAAKLSLFWSDRGFSAGRFPTLDRADYLDHAVPLAERERVDPARPTLDEVRTYLGGGPFANWAKSAANFAALDALDPADHKPYLRAQLYPARFVYSWMTGKMASNDDAVAYLRGRAPDGLDVELIGRAFQIRADAADPDPLFPARTELPRQVDACRRLVAG